MRMRVWQMQLPRARRQESLRRRETPSFGTHEGDFAKDNLGADASGSKGTVTPSAFEVGFQGTHDMHTIRFSLSEDEKMRLRGRIDRIDTLETEDKVYVKIVDYKSGNTTFSLLNLYHGLQLQLVVYLNAALELVARANPGGSPSRQAFFIITSRTRWWRAAERNPGGDTAGNLSGACAGRLCQ